MGEYKLPDHLNWQTFAHKGKDKPVELVLTRQGIDPQKLWKKVTQDPVYNALQYTKHDIQKHYKRDIPYMVCNACLVLFVLSTAMPFIPIHLLPE